MKRLLCDGFLAQELGAVAITARFFGGRRGGDLWGQRAGLSPVEAAVRVQFVALSIPECPPVAEFPLCCSAGRALLSRTFATPGLKIESGTLRGWDTPGARLVIPHGVTAIGKDAFEKCATIIVISIPESVTFIGDRAFRGCSSATAITIPGSVTSIGDCAFYGCSSATAIAIPGSVTSIGEKAFKGCRSATAITIPGSVTSIGHSAFKGCSGLLEIALPDGATIGRGAFEGCSGFGRRRLAELQARCARGGGWGRGLVGSPEGRSACVWRELARGRTRGRTRGRS